MSFRSDLFSLFLLIFLCAILYLPFLQIPFFDKGEPREALVVQSIIREGDWLFPMKNGDEIPSKPPLFHWTAALSSLAWGEISEGSVRFPSALFASLGVLVVYIFGRLSLNSRAALLGGVILATSFVYQKQAVEARVDMTLAFVITLSLTTFYWLYQGRFSSRPGMLGFYFLLGMGLLAKGPVSLILSGIVIFVFLGLRKRWDVLSRLCLHKGALITLAIGCLWYGLALARGGEDFFNRQVLHENLSRFFVYGEAGTGHQKPVYYYLPYLFLEGLPWTLFLPLVIAEWIKRKSYLEEQSLFLVLWVTVVFAFFSLAAGKRAVYLLPLYPPLALLTARWFERAELPGKGEAIWLPVLGGIWFLAGIALAVVLLGRGFPDFISSLLTSEDKAQWLLIEEVLAQKGWHFLILTGSAALVCVSLTWDLFRLRVRSVPLKMSLVSLAWWLFAQGAFIPAIAQARSYGPFMKETIKLASCEQLYLYGGGFDSASILFYRGRLVPFLQVGPTALIERLRSGKDHVIMTEREWQKIRGLRPDLPAPLLRSRGTGPDGDAVLVFVRGSKAGEIHP